jgi:plastocyanin
MMAIMVGICVVGGVIFFGMWDYWISSAPAAASSAQVEPVAPVTFTGKEIPVTLTFIESSDFRTLAFNALPGEPNNNPTINAEVGDKIVFDVSNGGKSFHAFGVTKETEGFSGIIPGSEIATASNPLKPGQGGQSEFIPPKDGIYFYICTVPGHREQGMVGKILVGEVSAEPTETKIMEPAPTPSSTMPVPGMEDVPEMIISEEPKPIPAETVPFTGTVSIPAGSSVPGCDQTNQCFIPADITIGVGETVTWSNDDTAAHTVTSGTPDGGPDGIFDSSLFMAGNTFSHTFDKTGQFNYFCMVHPWMTGTVQVN